MSNKRFYGATDKHVFPYSVKGFSVYFTGEPKLERIFDNVDTCILWAARRVFVKEDASIGPKTPLVVETNEGAKPVLRIAFNDQLLEYVWETFSGVDLDWEHRTKQDWFIFPAGTPQAEILGWFDERYGGITGGFMSAEYVSAKPLQRFVLVAAGILCLLCGAPLIGIGGAMYASGAYLQSNGETAEATVSRVSDNEVFIEYGHGGTTYAGVLNDSSVRHLKAGDSVEIRFDQSNPQFAQPAGAGRHAKSMVGAGLCSVALGGILCACGAYISKKQDSDRDDPDGPEFWHTDGKPTDAIA